MNYCVPVDQLLSAFLQDKKGRAATWLAQCCTDQSFLFLWIKMIS
jgi:hypothetical protein